MPPPLVERTANLRSLRRRFNGQRPQIALNAPEKGSTGFHTVKRSRRDIGISQQIEKPALSDALINRLSDSVIELVQESRHQPTGGVMVLHFCKRNSERIAPIPGWIDTQVIVTFLDPTQAHCRRPVGGGAFGPAEALGPPHVES